jgi:tetratricopeptide (TPR) repeat protein
MRTNADNETNTDNEKINSEKHNEYTANIRSITHYVKNTDESILLVCLYETLNDLKWLPEHFPNIKYLDVDKDHPNFIRDWFNIPAPPREVVAVRYVALGAEILKSVAGYAEYQRELLNEKPHVMMLWLPQGIFNDFVRMAANFWDWHTGGIFDFAGYSGHQTQQRVPKYDQILESDLLESDENHEKNPVSEDLERIIQIIEDDMIAIDEELADKNPDFSYIARKYALIAKRYGAMDKWQKASEFYEKAVHFYQDLAQKKPNMFLIDLAENTRQLSISQAKTDQEESALESIKQAVILYRDLIARSDLFLPNLAKALMDLSACQVEMNDHSGAQEAVGEAVQIYRTLMQQDFNAFARELTAFLGILSLLQREEGHLTEALESNVEAVKILRTLAETNSETALPDLALSLSILSVHYSAAQKRQEARDSGAEMVGIYRKLAKAQPNMFLPRLANGLQMLSMYQSDLGYPTGALESTVEAVQIYRELAKGHSEIFAKELEKSLDQLSQYQKNTPS